MINKIKKIIPEKYHKKWYQFKLKYIHKYRTISYSQGAEDIILNQFLKNQKKGFFVDVGAHHPVKYSNTYFFYKKGWTGIHIDPLPSIAPKFRSQRPKDLFLSVGVSEKEDTLTYYMFNEPALNGFDKELSLKRNEKFQEFEIIDTKQIKTLPLRELLDQNLPKNQTIDFLSVDTEGFDLTVLRLNDWKKYRPRFILVETLNATELEKVTQDPVFEFVTQQNYVLKAKLYSCMLFEDNL